MAGPVLLEPSANNAVLGRGFWFIHPIIIAGLVAWLTIAENNVARVIAMVFALLYIGTTIQALRARRVARILSDRFGALRLSARSKLPVARGGVIELELELPVRVAIRIERALLSLQLNHLREQAWGSASMAKTWLCDHREEVELAAAEMDAGDVFAGRGSFTVPKNRPATGDKDRWFVEFEMTSDECPVYSAIFPVTVR